jgi:hypothetical protein
MSLYNLLFGVNPTAPVLLTTQSKTHTPSEKWQAFLGALAQPRTDKP